MPARQSRGASRNTCRPARRQNRPVPGSNGPRPAWRPSRAAAPHQRRHQNRPGCARDEEQRVAQALDDCGRGQLGRHHEAGRQQRADDGGRRSQHARSRPPRVQHRKVSGSSSHRWGALTLASRQYTPPASPSASMAPARCRNGPPGSPKQAQNAAMALQPSRGSSSSTRITGAALVAAACRASSQRMAHGARQGAGRKSSCCFVQKTGGREALTLPCREGRQCVFCGRSSPISRQPAGMVTHL